MPVTVVTTFTKADASTEDYVNPEVEKVYEEYQNSNKVNDSQRSRSKDGLVQERTRVFVDQETWDAFKLEDAVVKNKALRLKWCADNNVKMSQTIVSK